MSDPRTPLEAAREAVERAQVKVAELRNARAFLRDALPEAEQALEAANEQLRRLKAPGARVANQKAELAALKRRINEASHQENDHV